MNTIVIIEDDKDIREILKIYLEAENFKVLEVENGDEALKVLETNKPDLVILDLMLPDTNGLSICKRIRTKYTYPIIMLTAKTADQDKILGLSYGADDYITKPFNPLEVLARVKAQLRRYKEYGETQQEDTIYYKALVLNRKNRHVNLNGKELKLTPTEFNLLEILLLNKGQVINAEKLFYLLREEEYYSRSTNTITVHIRNLREKMEESFEHPKYIKTVWGVGYIIEE